MFRMVYSILLPFLLPFAVCWIYRRRKNGCRKAFPVYALTATGLGLVLILLFLFSIPDRAPADSAYTPPKFENGRIVPATLQKTEKN